jgi:hypothetical protein
MADTEKRFFRPATTISHFFANDFSLTTNIRYPPTSRIESEDYSYSIKRTSVTTITHALVEGVAHDKQRRGPQFVMSMKPVTDPARQAIWHHPTRNIPALDGGRPRVDSRYGRCTCARAAWLRTAAMGRLAHSGRPIPMARDNG